MKEKKSISEKVTLWEKICHFLVSMGNIPEQTIVSMFLMIFYTDVCGMNPGAVATLFLITKILDAVNDPIIRFIIDHLPKTKMGRFRPYIVIFIGIMSLNFVLLFVGPAYAPQGFKLLVAYITYILIGITFTLADVPKNAVFPASTADMKQRASISIFRAFGAVVGGAVVGGVAAFVISAFETELTGYLVLVIGAAVFMVVISLIGVTGLKERVTPASEKKYTVKDTLGMVKVKGVLIALGAALVYATVINLITGANIYYATYILGNIEYASLYSVIMMIGMIPATIICPLLCGKVGVKKVTAAVLVFGAASSVIRILMPTSIGAFYAASVLGGVALGGYSGCSLIIIAQLTDVVEYHLGIRAEGTLTAVNSFITKVASAIGTALPGYILAWTGYAGTGGMPGAASLNGIMAAATWVPLILTVVSILMYAVLYPFGKKESERITLELQEKRKMESEE